jgi:hypothetical protein
MCSTCSPRFSKYGSIDKPGNATKSQARQAEEARSKAGHDVDGESSDDVQDGAQDEDGSDDHDAGSNIQSESDDESHEDPHDHEHLPNPCDSRSEQAGAQGCTDECRGNRRSAGKDRGEHARMAEVDSDEHSAGDGVESEGRKVCGAGGRGDVINCNSKKRKAAGHASDISKVEAQYGGSTGNDSLRKRRKVK